MILIKSSSPLAKEQKHNNEFKEEKVSLVFCYDCHLYIYIYILDDTLFSAQEKLPFGIRVVTTPGLRLKWSWRRC